jgi:ATP-binding protein involved in chromosome partitioning
MFEQVHVPILGIVENMSGFVCGHCGQTTNVFSQGGGRRAAEEIGVPFLGEIPLDAAIVAAGDAGRPVVADETLAAQAPSARAFLDVAGKLAQQISIVNEQTASVRHHPAEVQLEEGAVRIGWTDGHESRLKFRELRLACPCALCVDEMTGAPRLQASTVPADVKPLDLRTIGRYAIQFIWSDGHNTGIYSYDKLRALDPSAPAAQTTSRSRLPIFGGRTP